MFLIRNLTFFVVFKIIKKRILCYFKKVIIQFKLGLYKVNLIRKFKNIDLRFEFSL